MKDFNQSYLLEHIAQIIDRSRYGDELFFTDGKKAATEILIFLRSEYILVRDELEVETKYNEHSKAA
ncbi:hypothetical protein [Segetibacter koreensis]|uniref:hypothetical protein n=1 Tax=Segetibacter koreensis TaxID=398037 RepID=UPI0003700536|nr:hypothetical protein [Segetibacter koreensis]